MNIKEKIKEIEAIEIGFDMILAEKKASKTAILLDCIEQKIANSSLIKKEDIIYILQLVYGLIYEIGDTRQQLQSKADIHLAKRLLPIARMVFGKNKELLPYLHLNLNYSIGDEKTHHLLEQEISEIENKGIL